MMRVYIYEDNEKLVDRYCKQFGITPTKLVNSLIVYLEDQTSRRERAKIEDEVFRRFNKQ